MCKAEFAVIVADIREVKIDDQTIRWDFIFHTQRSFHGVGLSEQLHYKAYSMPTFQNNKKIGLKAFFTLSTPKVKEPLNIKSFMRYQ